MTKTLMKIRFLFIQLFTRNMLNNKLSWVHYWAIFPFIRELSDEDSRKRCRFVVKSWKMEPFSELNNTLWSREFECFFNYRIEVGAFQTINSLQIVIIKTLFFATFLIKSFKGRCNHIKKTFIDYFKSFFKITITFCWHTTFNYTLLTIWGFVLDEKF